MISINDLTDSELCQLEDRARAAVDDVLDDAGISEESQSMFWMMWRH